MKEIRIENIEDMSMSEIQDRFNTEMVCLKTWRCAKCKYCTVNGRSQGCDYCTNTCDECRDWMDGCIKHFFNTCDRCKSNTRVDLVLEILNKRRTKICLEEWDKERLEERDEKIRNEIGEILRSSRRKIEIPPLFGTMSLDGQLSYLKKAVQSFTE